MTRRAREAIAAATVVLCESTTGCGACEPDRSSPADAATRDSSSGRAAGWGAWSRPPLARVEPLHLTPCRAIAVSGVRNEDDSGADPVESSELAAASWLTLGPDARLVAKEPATGRELTFRGPGRARPCIDGRQESWLASGTFESASGNAGSPGAEEWVVTALGVVRFTAAKLSVEARPKDVRVTVGEGVVFVWVAGETVVRGADGGGVMGRVAADGDGWARVVGGTVALAPAVSPSTVDGARAAADSCAALSSAAYDLTRAVLAGRVEAGVVAQQVTTRRSARAACAVGELRAAALPPSDAREAIAAALAVGSRQWHALPLTDR